MRTVPSKFPMFAGLSVIGDILYCEKWMSCAFREERLSEAASRKSSFLMFIIIDIGRIDKMFLGEK